MLLDSRFVAFCREMCLSCEPGLHSNVHPAARLHWTERLGLLSLLQAHNVYNFVPALFKTPIVVKEVIRRMLSNCTAPALAANAAMARMNYSAAPLWTAAFALPNESLEVASLAFVRAGIELVAKRGAANVQSAIEACMSAPLVHARPLCSNEKALEWNVNYLHRSNSSTRASVDASSVFGCLWATAFRANFLPFWYHSNQQGIRASRLDSCQFAALQSLNSATMLTLALDEDERLKVQREALQRPHAARMTPQEVAACLGIEGVQNASGSTTPKGMIDALNALRGAGGYGAARILSFVRTAALAENVVVYDLGPRTRALQTRAIIKRSLAAELVPNATLDDVPEHFMKLCICVECRRIANAVADDGGSKWKRRFTEVGVAGSMLCTNPDSGDAVLRCARRSSASVKTAAIFEEDSAMREVETDACDFAAVAALLTSKAAVSGTVSRVRRDAKSSMEQRQMSTACGTCDMLNVDLLGKAVCFRNNWYAICAFCGACTRFYTSNRFESEVCCMRCDYTLLNRSAGKSDADSGTKAAATCRFCGRVDPMRSGMRWKMVKAPHDTSGPNANLPPPLRNVHFCAQHFRSWVPSAAKTMPTRVILSHLLYGARPCFDSAIGTSAQPKRQLAKRRRIAKKA